MSRILDALIEDIADDVAALTIHAHNELGATVSRLSAHNINGPLAIGDKLALLIYAVRACRCDGCAQFATHGRLCATCHAGSWHPQSHA